MFHCELCTVLAFSLPWASSQQQPRTRQRTQGKATLNILHPANMKVCAWEQQLCENTCSREDELLQPIISWKVASRYFLLGLIAVWHCRLHPDFLCDHISIPKRRLPYAEQCLSILELVPNCSNCMLTSWRGWTFFCTNKAEPEQNLYSQWIWKQKWDQFFCQPVRYQGPVFQPPLTQWTNAGL